MNGPIHEVPRSRPAGAKRARVVVKTSGFSSQRE